MEETGLTVRPQAGALSVSGETEQTRAIAETQAAMVIAKRFPRNHVQALDRILNACTRSGLAEAALYEYSRGGTAITGPSIRLAEAIAQNWGNLQFGIRELDQRAGWSTVEAFAWDVETNTRQVKVFQVQHVRNTKKGSYALEDSRDIYEMVANQGARRLRACILGIVPGDVVEEAVAACETTLKTRAEITPERIAGMLERFAGYGVQKAQIEARIQRRVDAITPAQMVNLGKIYNSLKDGMSVPSDWFEMQKDEVKALQNLAEKIRATTLGNVPPSEQPTYTETETLPPEVAEIRRLKATGFSAWVKSELARGTNVAWTDALRAEVERKCASTLGTTLAAIMAPMAKRVEHEPPAQEIAAGNGKDAPANGNSSAFAPTWCPKDEGAVPDKRVCNTQCKERKGCPAW